MEKRERERPFGRPRRRSEDCNKMDLKEINWKDLNWVNQTLEKVKRREGVKTAISILVSQEANNFLTT